MSFKSRLGLLLIHCIPQILCSLEHVCSQERIEKCNSFLTRLLVPSDVIKMSLNQYLLCQFFYVSFKVHENQFVWIDCCDKLCNTIFICIFNYAVSSILVIFFLILNSEQLHMILKAISHSWVCFRWPPHDRSPGHWYFDLIPGYVQHNDSLPGFDYTARRGKSCNWI